ncbi:Nicotianamine synthase [Geopyxis carbonaria]|nr:Nicotianamine synthase [Geopyxis carbonaria]
MTSIPTSRPAAGPASLAAAPAPVRPGAAAHAIAWCYENLTALSSDLTPRPAINTLFHFLVSVCTAPGSPRHTSDTLTHPTIAPIIAPLRRLCSAAESALESHHAYRIAGRLDPPESFPYTSNYALLARLELHTLLGTPHPPPQDARVLFLGCGPMPLSVLSLAAIAPGWRFTGVDICPRAIDLARGVATVHGALAERCEWIVDDAEEPTEVDVGAFDIVFVAGLVEAKERVFKMVAARGRRGAAVVLRSARGLREVLYPAVDEEMVWQMGLEVVGVAHPEGEVVNSVLVARVPSGSRM